MSTHKNKKNNQFIWLLFSIGTLTFLATCIPETLFLLAGSTAIVPLFLVIQISLKNNTLPQRLLAVSYIFGSSNCWIFGFLVCYYLEFNIAQYPWITLALANITTWTALFGSLAAKSEGNKAAYKLPNIPKLSEKVISRGLLISGIVFAIFMLASYISGGFSSRFEVGTNLSVGSALYILSAISFIQPLFFIFIGASLSAPIFHYRNIILMIMLLAGVVLLSLSGGRELAIRVIIYFFLGTFIFSKVPRKKILGLVFIFVPIALIWINIIGYARAIPEFGSADLNTRIELMYRVALEGGEKQGNKYDDPLYGLFTRITEPSGQKVIDGVFENQDYIGLANLDRVAMIFLPKFLYPGEKIYDDGHERLEKYGIFATKFTGAPITLMADAYERQGFIGTAIVSFLASFCLTHLGDFLCNRKNVLFGYILLISYSFFSIRIYSMSVLGLINFLTYSIFRDSILLWCFLLLLGKLKKHAVMSNQST